jgi:hypothetical protein
MDKTGATWKLTHPSSWYKNPILNWIWGKVGWIRENYCKNRASEHNGSITCKNHRKSTTDLFWVIPMGDTP